MKNALFIIFCTLCCSFAKAGNTEVKTALTDQSLRIDQQLDLHLTDSKHPLQNSIVDLASTEAWLFFDNVRPSDVAKEFAGQIRINGAPLKIGKGGNARIAIYKQGAVVIPHTADIKPLETFTKEKFAGAGSTYALYIYYSNRADSTISTEMVAPLKDDNKIRSFRLRRGYMATFATESDGTGYSRVFVADQNDIICEALPEELNGKISFVRVFQWQWPSKKGWCGGRGSVVASNSKNRQDNEVDLTRSTWLYSWGNADPISPDAEFVPMKWSIGGHRDFRKINSRTGVTHVLGYNEPNRPDQSNMSVEDAIKEWPELLKSGLRLGSPSVSDNSKLEDWLYKFIDECGKRNYRVDYVTVHAYWGAHQMRTPQDWYNTLREIHLRTGRPIWITEWNNGANWTNEQWPSRRKEQFSKQVFELKNILHVLDTASFIERYSIYNWVEDKRAIVLDSFSLKQAVDGSYVKERLLKQTLSPAGVLYRDNNPRQAFNANFEFVPSWVTERNNLTEKK